MLKLSSDELAIESLYDCWAFLALLDYHGGVNSWDQCHYDYLLMLQAPQLYRSGRLVGDTLARWQYINQYSRDTTRPYNNRLLKMPRGHYKSSLVMLYSMWRIYRNPNIRILHSTNVLELSESFVRELRSYFEDEDLQAKVWNRRPHIKGRLIPILDAARRRSMKTEATDSKVVWNNEELQVIRGIKAKESTFASTSVGSKKTGSHYDLLLMDDVVDYDNSSSVGKVRKVFRWAADMVSVVNKVIKADTCGVLPNGTEFVDYLGDERVCTGTHYDPNDYYVTIEAKAKSGVLPYNVFERNIYYNGMDNSGGYILRGFTEQMENELRAELEDSPGVFDAQYLNKVMSHELQTLSTAQFKWVPQSTFLTGLANGVVTFRLDDDEDFDSVRPILALDPAISLKARADDTAIIVGGVSEKGRLVTLDCLAGHYEPEATCKAVSSLIKKWGVKTAYIESVGFQKLLQRMVLKQLSNDAISCSVVEYIPKGNKHKRIEYQLHPYASKGRVVVAARLKSQPKFTNAIDFFGKATSRDDIPDALSVIAEKSRPPTIRKSKRHDSFWTTKHERYNSLYGGIH